jgi:hypothetical protein
VAGCVTDRELSPLADDQDAPAASTAGAPSGESASFTWQSFTYPSRDSVIDNHRWNDQQTVRLVETTNVDEILDADRENVPDLVDYVEATNFAEEFLIAIELSVARSPYEFAVRDVLWGEGDEVVVDGVRQGAGDENKGVTIACLIRVSATDRTVPPVARVVYEREQPRDGEGTWGEFKNYPDDGRTAFSLLMENDDGEFVMQGYPSALERGKTQQFVVMVENQESPVVEYSVVVQLHRVNTDGGSTVVEERDELDRFTTEVEYDQRKPHERNITPTMAGERLRLAFLLYKNDPPSEPTKDNAYRTLQLWVEVTE